VRERRGLCALEVGGELEAALGLLLVLLHDPFDLLGTILELVRIEATRRRASSLAPGDGPLEAAAL
jgi:hypothetical protein